MKDLAAGFEALNNSMGKKVMSLDTLINDIESMKNGLKNNEPYNRKTVEPMTRLRKNTNNLKIAESNPDMQFIRDRIHDILGI